MASFDKTLPTAIYQNTGEPLFVPITGGTINGDVTITGTETVNNLVATTANATTLTVSGATTLNTVTSDAINQGKVGFPSFVLGASLTGTVISPLPPSTNATCSVAMLCTDVVYTTPGAVTFVVSNNFPFAIGQSVTVANTTNWNGNYQVLSVGTGTIRCNTSNTSPSEPGISALVVPLFSAGLYQVSGVCRIRQNTAPTAGSTTEGISFGLDIGVTAPSNYTTTSVQATNNPLYTITGSYGEAVFPIVGTVRASAPLSRLWLVVNTGAQTGSYSVIFRQFTVTPIGVYRA